MTEQVLQSIASTLTTLTVLVMILVFVDLGSRAYAFYKVQQVQNRAEARLQQEEQRNLQNMRESNCRYWTVTSPDPDKAKLFCD